MHPVRRQADAAAAVTQGVFDIFTMVPVGLSCVCYMDEPEQYFLKQLSRSVRPRKTDCRT
jgi:hypothetical protein